jgi:hypothetical protein
MGLVDQDRPTSDPAPLPATALPLLLPEDYSDGAARRDRLLAGQIPDLRGRDWHLADILAALEWQVSVLDVFNEQGYGDKVVADVSGATTEEWVSDPRRSVARGLLALNNSFSPIWILQRAGQSAHIWPGFREQPIFTHHVDHQFSWLKPVSLHPTWLIYYLANSGLEIGPPLEAAIVGATVRAAGAEALEIKREGDNTVLVAPLPSEFFLTAADGFTSHIDGPRF